MNGKVTFGGRGDSKISWTTREDTARFLGYAFTHLTTSDLSGKTLRIEGDKLVSSFLPWALRSPREHSFQTYNEVIAAHEQRSGKKVEVTRIPREVLAEKAAAGDLFSTFYYDMDVNGGEVGIPLDNDLFPGWNPKKVLDVIP